MYVSTASGSLFQINYHDRVLEVTTTELYELACSTMHVCREFVVRGQLAHYSCRAALRCPALRKSSQCIYKLHSGAINSISINEGFCVTGSDDCFLRVWPLDFSDFYLQAQHKGAINCVQISTDGLHVLVGKHTGTSQMHYEARCFMAFSVHTLLNLTLC